MRRLFYYNSTCEMAVANNHHSYTPPLRLQQFEDDLAPLTMFLASAGDIVLCSHTPDEDFTCFWQSVGKEIPSFKTPDQIKAEAEELVPAPWGYSKAAIFNLGRLGIPACNFPKPLQAWLPAHRNFFSRRTSALFEESLSNSNLPTFCRPKHTPQIIDNYPALELTIAQSHEPMVIKSLWSSSGRGIVMIREESHLKPALIWAKGKIRHEGAVIVEPLMAKVADFSFQFHLSAENDVKYMGINHFATDKSGKFDKELIGKPAIFGQLTASGILPSDWEEQCSQAVAKEIAKMEWNNLYEGIMGFDAMIVQDDEGNTGIRCCVEINFRNNMGLVNMALRQFLDDAARGWWKIEQFEPGGWCRFIRMMKEKHPPIIENGKLKSGFFALTPSSEKMIYGAWGVI
jgi:hypothetical protein